VVCLLLSEPRWRARFDISSFTAAYALFGMTALSRDARRTNFSCSKLISVFILFCSASYAALSGLLEAEVITGNFSTGAELPVAPPGVGIGFKSDSSRGASNACLDSVATFTTASSDPSPLLLPGNRSLCRRPQCKSL
jgi:hypothetical protein